MMFMEKKLRTVPLDAMIDRHIGKRGTPDCHESILAKVRQGLEEVSQIEQGKLKGRPAQQLLDEL
jgi:hypothetical protein